MNTCTFYPQIDTRFPNRPSLHYWFVTQDQIRMPEDRIFKQENLADALIKIPSTRNYFSSPVHVFSKKEIENYIKRKNK